MVQQADWNDGVFLFVHGIAKVRRFTREGEEVVVGLVGIGEIFGEQALLIEGGLRSADIGASWASGLPCAGRMPPPG